MVVLLPEREKIDPFKSFRWVRRDDPLNGLAVDLEAETGGHCHSH
jgi:hypothetical protein